MLCIICAQIDFHRLLTTPIPNEEIELGSWVDVQSREAVCDFCAIVVSAVRNGARSQKGKLDGHDELLLSPHLNPCRHLLKDEDGTPSREFRLRIYNDEYDIVGDILLHGDDAGLVNNSPYGHGRLLNPKAIDFDLVQKWVTECQQLHDKCREDLALKILGITVPEQLFLINVRTNCIESAALISKYAALSYTWGNAIQFLTKKDQLAVLVTPGSLSKAPIPATVRDAMILTKKIGFDYLWVDALCIIQDSDEHKSMQISKMHHIYAAATVTIVAVTGNAADSGLPGVRTGTRNIQQCIRTVAGLRFLARMSYSDLTLRTSAYNTRAWTYQESSIARSLLFITPAGVVMRCCQDLRVEELMLEEDACQSGSCRGHSIYYDSSQHNIWRELLLKNSSSTASTICTCRREVQNAFKNGKLPAIIPPPKQPADGLILSQILACEACIAFHKTNEEQWAVYKDLVVDYTNRKMRFASDRLPAFAGISSILGLHFESKFLFGLPEKFLDLTLTWIPRSNLNAPCRRGGLEAVPTWSWASHEIPAGSMGDLWLTSEVDWHCIDESGKLRRVHSLKTIGTHVPLRKDYLKPITLLELATHGLVLSTDLPFAALYGWCQISSHFYLHGLRLCDRDKHLVYSGFLEVQFSDVPPVSTEEYAPVEVLCLSRSGYAGVDNSLTDWENQKHGINLLIIERQGNVTKRLGFICIADVQVWEDAKKEWILIKLV